MLSLLLLSFTIITDTLPNGTSVWCIQDKRINMVNYTLIFDYELKNIKDIGYIHLTKHIMEEKFPKFEIRAGWQSFGISFDITPEKNTLIKRYFQDIFSKKVSDAEYKSAINRYKIEKRFHHKTLKDMLIETAFAKDPISFSPYDFDPDKFDKEILKGIFDKIFHYSHLTIIISGDINSCDAINFIRTIIKKRKKSAPTHQRPYKQSNERIVLMNKGTENILWMGFHLPEINTKAFNAIYIFSYMVKKTAIFTDTPLFTINYTIPDTSNWQSTTKNILQDLHNLADTLNNIQLDRLKQKIITDFWIKNALYPAFNAFFVHCDILPEQWVLNIKDVQIQDIKDAVNNYIVRNNLTVITGEKE